MATVVADAEVTAVVADTAGGVAVVVVAADAEVAAVVADAEVADCSCLSSPLSPKPLLAAGRSHPLHRILQ